jgi:hypothetical protein
LILEKVDVVATLGVMQQALRGGNACPPAYCTMPLASVATVNFAKRFERAG